MRSRGRETVWLALSAVTVVTGLAVVFGTLLDRGDEPSRPDALHRQVTVRSAMRGPTGESSASDARLAPVAAETRTASEEPSVGANAWTVPDSTPAGDRLRIIGRVVDGDGASIASSGAVVTVMREPEWSDDVVVLGRVPVATNGRFWIDVPSSPRREPVEVRLLAPGYESVREEIGEGDFAASVARVTLTTSRGALHVRGRVLDPSGAPVSLAEVSVVEWGAQGRNIESHDLETASDGTFESEIGWIGWVDVFAHHPGHGIAKAGRRLEAGETVLDLGDLTLTAWAAISDSAAQAVSRHCWRTRERGCAFRLGNSCPGPQPDIDRERRRSRPGGGHRSPRSTFCSSRRTMLPAPSGRGCDPAPMAGSASRRSRRSRTTC